MDFVLNIVAALLFGVTVGGFALFFMWLRGFDINATSIGLMLSFTTGLGLLGTMKKDG